MSSEVYLGDGLYATFDGFQITLKAPRMETNSLTKAAVESVSVHYVALEPSVFEALIQYAINIGWLEKGQVIK